VRSGRLRAIAVTTPQRLPSLPDIPAIAETVPGYEAVLWYGLWGPPKMPKSIIMRLNREVKNIVELPETKGYLSKEGIEADYMSSEDFSKFIRAEIMKWAKVVKATGLKPE
jgi:tripartite-type tricarboxylate transporter receptor subunit TctC